MRYPVSPTSASAAALPFPPACGKGGIPAVLTSAMDALDAFVDDPACLPSLNAANGSTRQQRLERRIACVRLLKAHLKYTDLVSLRVGVPRADGSFADLTLKFLAKQAGLTLRRAERAMRDLQIAGLVRVRQRCEQRDDGSYRGCAALRFVPTALFVAFKLGKWLRQERMKAQLRRQRSQAAREKAARREREQAHGSLFMNGLGHAVRRLARGVCRAATPTTATDLHDAEYAKQLQLRAAAFYAREPERGHEWAYERARDDLAPLRNRD